MVQSSRKACDEALLDRYLNSDLSRDKEDHFLEHLEHCSNCREQVDTLTAFARDFAGQVDTAVQSVDFTSLEKEVLTTVIHQPRSGKGGAMAVMLFKFTFTAGLIVGMLALLSYLYLEGHFGF
jgi:hypothetical protein